MQVLVGEGKQPFWVHKHEICSRSEFFKAACSERLTKPGETTTIELLEEDYNIFDIYLRCIYKDRVDIGDKTVQIHGEARGEEFFAFEDEHRLVKAYILAEKLLDAISANLFIDEMISLCVQGNLLFYKNIANLVENSSTTESCMRKLMIDVLINAEELDDIKAVCELNSIPKDFISEILIKQSELFYEGPGANPDFLEGLSKCCYHQHTALRPRCGKDCQKRNIK